MLSAEVLPYCARLQTAMSSLPFWKLHFTGVSNAPELKMRLENSAFLKKEPMPKQVQAIDNEVIVFIGKGSWNEKTLNHKKYLFTTYGNFESMRISEAAAFGESYACASTGRGGTLGS